MGRLMSTYTTQDHEKLYEEDIMHSVLGSRQGY